MKVGKILVCLTAAVALSMAVFGCTKVQIKKAEPVNSAAQESDKIVVNVVIDGSQGEDKAVSAKGQIEINVGDTVYDALKKFCDSQGYEITGDSSYIKAIGGLGEGSFGADPCGWMFSIDGEYAWDPADEATLEDGNEVVLEFVK